MLDIVRTALLPVPEVIIAPVKRVVSIPWKKKQEERRQKTCADDDIFSMYENVQEDKPEKIQTKPKSGMMDILMKRNDN